MPWRCSASGRLLGPIMGPALGGWLTYDYSWHWIFYINLPVGVLCTLGILVFIRQTRNVHREPFDFVGFLTLSSAECTLAHQFTTLDRTVYGSFRYRNSSPGAPLRPGLF